MNFKSSKAITLVALIITIIILLILAGVSLSMVLGDNGLINKAQSSVDKYQQSANNEQELLNSIEQYIDSKGKLTLSETSGTCIYPNTLSFTVTNNPSGGTISVTSDNTSVADVSASGNTITVTPKAVGTAKITVKSAATENYTEQTVTYAVTVKTPISTSKSYVGSYADIDNDGTVDGVIYADLAVGGSVQWGGLTATIPKDTMGLKSYYVSQNSYTNGINGPQEVIAAASTPGMERFYVMALTNACYSNWYTEAAGKLKDNTSLTSTGFGTGRINTQTLMEAWNAGDYGAPNPEKDMWGKIQSQVDKGWFVPSIYEWVAFLGNLSISSSNKLNKGVAR